MAGASQRNRGDWQDISYLEAIVRAYIDGAPTPLPLSSGLEDYFLAPTISIAVATPMGWRA